LVDNGIEGIFAVSQAVILGVGPVLWRTRHQRGALIFFGILLARVLLKDSLHVFGMPRVDAIQVEVTHWWWWLPTTVITSSAHYLIY
jgi:hypothetical protein